jgi:hypothetical protein
VDRGRLTGALGFTASLLLPSIVVIHKYLGYAGVVVYVAIAGTALMALHGRFDRIAARLTMRRAAVLAAVIACGLVVAFAVGYPLANSGIIGPGSDRDEHLNMGARELIEGRFPYYQIGPWPYNSIISQMPGALLMAIPFVLLGNGSYGNFLWLAVFVAAAARVGPGFRTAVLLLALILATAPIVLNEFVIGGDLLGNAIYVLVFTLAVVELVPRGDFGAWQKVAAALALGVGLSSRGQFLLVLPLVSAALARRAGAAAAAGYTAIVCAGFAAVTVPFVLYDPAAFSPFDTAGFLQSDYLPSWWKYLMAGACGVAAVAAALRPGVDARPVLLRRCAGVLAMPVVIAAALRSYDTGTLDLGMLGYGLSFLFFGALGYAPRRGE